MQARKDDGFALLIVYIAALRPMNKFSGNTAPFRKNLWKTVSGQFSSSKGISRHKISEVSAHFTTAETDGKQAETINDEIIVATSERKIRHFSQKRRQKKNFEYSNKRFPKVGAIPSEKAAE